MNGYDSVIWRRDGPMEPLTRIHLSCKTKSCIPCINQLEFAGTVLSCHRGISVIEYLINAKEIMKVSMGHDGTLQHPGHTISLDHEDTTGDDWLFTFNMNMSDNCDVEYNFSLPKKSDNNILRPIADLTFTGMYDDGPREPLTRVVVCGNLADRS